VEAYSAVREMPVAARAVLRRAVRENPVTRRSLARIVSPRFIFVGSISSGDDARELYSIGFVVEEAAAACRWAHPDGVNENPATVLLEKARINSAPPSAILCRLEVIVLAC